MPAALVAGPGDFPGLSNRKSLYNPLRGRHTFLFFRARWSAPNFTFPLSPSPFFSADARNPKTFSRARAHPFVYAGARHGSPAIKHVPARSKKAERGPSEGRPREKCFMERKQRLLGSPCCACVFFFLGVLSISFVKIDVFPMPG